MRYTQFLIFEIGTECNLGHVHGECPNRHLDRYRYVDTTRPMGDALIVDTAARMHQEFGFRGLVGFHYYNEPLCQSRRMFRLMRAMRERVPGIRFLLWSNGMLLPSGQADFRLFERVYLTDYDHLPDARVRKLQQQTDVTICRWDLDDRLTSRLEVARTRPCRRMFTEFILDYYGNVHLCCFDWRGLGFRGNVQREPLESIVKRWKLIRGRVGGETMAVVSPDVCRYCTHGGKAISRFEPDIADAAERFVAKTPDDPRVAVVFVSYQAVPEHRLRDHLRWNEALYTDAAVYVVAEKPLPWLPSYATTVVVPVEDLPHWGKNRPVFSLALTKNRGIEAALLDGCDVLIVTDVDITFPPDTWHRMVHVQPDEAIIPYYQKALTYATRSTTDDLEPGMTGTLSMRADAWQEIRFDQTYEGYGGEDGRLLKAIQAADITPCRDRCIWHIAHNPNATDQVYVPGHGRDDCWGRDSGFNPDHFEVNRRKGKA